MWTFRYFNRLLLTTLLAVAIPVIAFAQPTEDNFMQHVDLGVQLFQRQYYDVAIQEFQKAYALRATPRLLFNIGQALLKLGKPREALDYFEKYQRTEQGLSEEARRLLSRTMADGQVQIEAERVLEEQAQQERQEKLAQEEKERREQEQLRAQNAALSARYKLLLSSKSQRPPLADPVRRRRVIGMFALGGLSLGLILAGTVTLALDGYPACDRKSPQELCLTHLQSKLPGGLLLGAGIATLAGSQIGLGLSFRPTPAEKDSEPVGVKMGTLDAGQKQ